MATLVVELRHREIWVAEASRSDDQQVPCETADSVMSRMNGAAGHHRSYSDVHDQTARPRLPSINNLLDDVGRPDLSRAPYREVAGVTSTFQNMPDMTRATPVSPSNYQSWSPSEAFSHRPQLDLRPNFASRNSNEQYPDSSRYSSRDNVVLPQIAQLESGMIPPYPAHPPAEPVSPESRTTAKRVVREERIPGKGLCYIYDDGSVCQKVINGDTVNPKWGTTKAGKPRKRLGQACNTCREKKIKCDPSYPKCSQCYKFNRECRFEPTNSRTSHKSPKMRPSTAASVESQNTDDNLEPRNLSAAPSDMSSPSDSSHLQLARVVSRDEHQTPHTARETSYVRSSAVPTKRTRVADLSPDDRFDSDPSLDDGADAKALIKHQDHLSHDVDPMLVDSDLARACLGAFFAHIDSPKYAFLPQKQFMAWAETDHNKSPEARLVLYCVLTVGALVNPTTRKSGSGRPFIDVATQGLRQVASSFSLELIHARLIFAMYEFLLGHKERAWDLCGAALRVACAMKLHTEPGIQDQITEKPAAYGLDRTRLAECMRRTFWSLFLQDQFGVACLGYGTTFSKADMFIRLPCPQNAYEEGHKVDSPVVYVEDGILKETGDKQDPVVAALSRQIRIGSLSCDIQTLATRAKHQATLHRGDRSQTVRRGLEEQLNAWEREYASHLGRLAPTSRGTTQELDDQTCGGLYIMYHFARMEFNRHVHHAHLDPRQIAGHAGRAYHHACQTLDLAHQLVSHGNTSMHDYMIAVTSPVTGHAIMTALDILTAAGLNSDLLENQSRLMARIMAGVEVLEKLASRWISARAQQETVSERIKTLLSSVRAGVADRKVAFYVTEPMAFSLGKEDDIIYGVDRIQYLHATAREDGVRGYSDLVEVCIKKEKRH